MSQNHTGLIFFPAFDWAISPTHPERQERLLYTRDQLLEEGVFDLPYIHEYKPEIAADADILRAHFCIPTVERVITPSHRVAAGGAVKAARLVMDGICDKSFAIVRPPGHHAMKVVNGNRGFCSINNEAVMIEVLRDHYDVQKIAVVDTDCHHGDGTQDIYWHDPDVLFISMHQDGRTIFPGSGFADETGGPMARGRTLNLPLPPGTSDEGVLWLVDEVVLPVLKDFQPDLIINSAGQDNHFSDPITHMAMSALGYAQLNEKLNPDICVLEGGYSIQSALPYMNLGIILAMAGYDYSGIKEPGYESGTWRQDDRIMKTIKQLPDQALPVYFDPGDPPHDEGDLVTRDKRVFYDTEGIMEYQTETLRVCGQCRGALMIESETSRSDQSVCVDIPRRVCPECREQAEKWIDTERARGEAPVHVMDKSQSRNRD